MILLFNKNIPNQDYQVIIDVSDQYREMISPEIRPISQTVYNFFTPSQPLDTSCNYPINIAELFPYWVQKDTVNTVSLITLTESYYKWLSCNTQDINKLSFFRLEDLTDTEEIPADYLKYLTNTYLNSLPIEYINTTGTYIEGLVDEKNIRKLLDNVKINLYGRKGTDQSFKLVINELFDIDPERISVSYPKKYIMRLNSGRFDWMSDEQDLELGELTSSCLNYSVLYDANNLWQDYSYVVNVSELSVEYYKNIVKPLLHPAGTIDFYQIRQDIFNNIDQTIKIVKNEIPIIKNYQGYTLGSNQSLAVCYAGFTSPTYTFPSWDEEIYSKYYSGMTFGMINIEDFLLLSPLLGYTYPNETRSVTICP